MDALIKAKKTDLNVNLDQTMTEDNIRLREEVQEQVRCAGWGGGRGGGGGGGVEAPGRRAWGTCTVRLHSWTAPPPVAAARAPQIRSLDELKAMAKGYGFDLGRPAESAKEAVQWLVSAAGPGWLWWGCGGAWLDGWPCLTPRRGASGYKAAGSPVHPPTPPILPPVQYFGYLAAVKEQDGAAMSLGRVDGFLDIYFERE